MLVVCAAMLVQEAVRDWPQWRGPARDGTAAGVRLPRDWLQSDLKQRWRVPVGAGYASPIVIGDRVFTFGREQESEVVRALELATGKVRWRVSYPARYEVKEIAGVHGAGPRATPVFHAGRLYTFGINEVLHCVDGARGDVHWRIDFPRRFGTEPPGYGASSSPLVTGRHVIVAAADRLMAVDRFSGSIVWRALNDSFYSSLIEQRFDGRAQLVGFARYRLTSVDSRSGRLLWSQSYPSMWGSNIVTPVVWKDRVIVSAPTQGTTALRVRRRDGAWVTEPIWRSTQFRAYLTSPVVYGDLLFGLDEPGRLFCLDVNNGRTLWSDGNFSDYGTLVLAGDQLLILSGYGELTAVEATGEGYRELGQRQLSDSATWTHLVLAAGCLFVRDKSHLTCYELRI